MRQRVPLVLSCTAVAVAVLGASPLGQAARDRLTASGPAGGDLTGSYPDPEIAPNAVGTRKVRDDSLTGADVNESTLGQVPSALLGGFGQTGPKAGICDPVDTSFVTCAAVGLNLPERTRVLISARISADSGTADSGHGTCRLGTSVFGGIAGSDTYFAVPYAYSDHGTLVGVTPPLGPGSVSFGIDCNQTQGGRIDYLDAQVTAVAISPS